MRDGERKICCREERENLWDFEAEEEMALHLKDKSWNVEGDEFEGEEVWRGFHVMNEKKIPNSFFIFILQDKGKRVFW